MRTPDTASQSLRDRSVLCKVAVGSTDLSAYQGRDWVESVELSAGVDAALTSARIGLWRESHWLTLAPLNAASKANIAGGSYVPMLALNALVIVSTSEALSRGAAEASGSANPWHEVFRGRITEIDWSGKTIQLNCLDIAYDFQRVFLRRERWYGRGASHRGIDVWCPTVAVALYDRVLPTVDTAVSKIYECTYAGTTGATEPVWPPSATFDLPADAGTTRQHSTDVARIYFDTSHGVQAGWWVQVSCAGDKRYNGHCEVSDAGPLWIEYVTGDSFTEAEISDTTLQMHVQPAQTINDGTAKWRQIVFGVGVWCPGAAVAVGQYCANRRYVARAWTANTRVNSGDSTLTAASAAQKRFVCTGNGITGATEPTWPTVVGDFVQDGSAWWKRIRNDRAPVSGDDPALDRYMCSRAGTTATYEPPDWPDELAEPTFPATLGASLDESSAADSVRWTRLPITDDGLVALEAIVAGMMRDAVVDGQIGYTPPDPWCVESPQYWVRPFRREQMRALESMRRVAQQIGWDLRTVYHPTATNDAVWGRWRLTLWEPDRDATASLATFTADDYYQVSRAAIKIEDIRNAIEVTYQDWTDLYDGVNPKLKRCGDVNTASIAKYGYQYMALGAGTANEVNTLAEAQKLAVAVLSDLCEPLVDLEVEVPYRWWIELGDLYTLTADMRYWSDDQKMAVIGVRHSIIPATRTMMAMRAHASAGVRRWHQMGVEPGGANPRYTVTPTNGSTYVIPQLRGAEVRIVPPRYAEAATKMKWGPPPRHEVYVSTNSQFTPSSATLVATSASSRILVPGLTPGTTYYVRVITTDGRGARSQPTVAVPVTAKYIEAVDLAVVTTALALILRDSVQEFGAGTTTLGFNTVEIDTASMVVGAAVVVPAGAAGFYRVFASASATGIATSAVARLNVNVDGGLLKAGPTVPGGGACDVAVEYIAKLSVGDEITISIYTDDSSGVLEVGAQMIVERLLSRD